MEAILNYALKAGIGILVLYLFYFALLRGQNNFRFNRLYLLLAPPLALLLPLLSWPAFMAPEAAVTQALQAIQLQEVTVTAFRPKATEAALVSLSWPAILTCIYSIGILLVLGNLVRQLWQLRQVKKMAAPAMAAGEAQVYQLSGSYPSFAFGRSVFISQRDNLNAAEQEQVLAHELAHVRFGHTWDVLFYEVLTALLWFHPAVWLMKQELRDVHEYQADATVVACFQAQKYTSLLSREALLSMGLPVGSHFTKPQVLKRLHMLQQFGRKPGWGKPLLTLPLLVVLLFSLTGQQVVTGVANPFTPPVQAALPVSNLPDKGQPKEQVAMLAPAAETPPSKAEAKPAAPAPDKTVEEPVLEEEKTAEVPVQENKPEDDNIHNLLEVKPYTYVEQMPTFNGGEGEMLRFLAKNIRYPLGAQQAGVEGLVVLSFVVGQNGRLSDFQIVKKLSADTDEEALRVVKLMDGKWQAGRQNGKVVPVRYTLPVRFAIK
ncbi:M56 family metallopeptidase [Pontibacter akesuensis]|uniref:Outer membrane transport energization protein TonB n=1 Tax=Pontibacter akesuensis TaxID=388950 RepID=A0A1I7H460_9BACT|nr:M56 family metallopeptidase [Pontibacter akesuensis]GHA53572.1 cell envelope biogenesis protein TonB [Pontibacter akesuensis]SFU55412.1 outer membrane transport energization protein TonB [Pontibacter akesuensis]